MLKSALIFALTIVTYCNVHAQAGYEYITISRFVPGENQYGVNWSDSLRAGSFSKYVYSEKKIITSTTGKSSSAKELYSLLASIKSNGTEDVSKCFIPRHSINFYKGGKLVRFLLICFECDGLRFSDDPAKTFVRSVSTREKQMRKLKGMFERML